MNKTIEQIQNLTFGVELEYENISRERAAKAIHSVVGGRVNYDGGGYETWTVYAPDGRQWKAVRDGSLGRLSAEVVTPILKWEDMDTLQEIVRALRKAGAKATEAGSQHVHIGTAGWTPQNVANFARIFYKQERLVLKALGTLESRLTHYTRPTDREFIGRLEAIKPKTKSELNRAWFGTETPNPNHYHSTRYRAVNLVNYFMASGTIELRAANASTHAGEVKSVCCLALAIAAFAKRAKCASSKNQREYSEASAKYDFRVWMLRLGLIGPEFKNVRTHLLKRLPGSSAWKNGRPEER